MSRPGHDTSWPSLRGCFVVLGLAGRFGRREGRLNLLEQTGRPVPGNRSRLGFDQSFGIGRRRRV